MSELPLCAQRPSISDGEVGMATRPRTIRDDRRWGLANSKILGPEVLELPPALDDMIYEEPKGFRLRTLDEILDDLLMPVMPPAWHNGKLLSGLRWFDQLDTRLPLPSPQDHSVYLVTNPRGSLKYRFIHWSLYSQGFFYHLTAIGSDALHYMEAKSGKTSPSQLNQTMPVALKLQNVINPIDADFVPPTRKTQQIALQAYHVGYTRFTSEQIRRLATYIISGTKSYNVFEQNCQLFALSLAERTVMAQRNGSVFVGDMHQIARWDSTGEFGSERPFSKSTGYVLAGARKDDKERRTMWAKMSGRSIYRLDRKAKAIAILYREGERATGAYDPSGRREGIRYIMYLFYRDLATMEIWEDLKHRRWRDAFVGRLEWRKSSYIREVAMARSGDRLAELLLPLHRWILRVTEEERLVWAAEAAEADLRSSQDVADD